MGEGTLMRDRFLIILLCLGILSAFPSEIVAQWTKSVIIEERWISCLAASGSNVYAGTSQGEIFMSTDHGSRWKAVQTGLPSETAIHCLMVSGEDLFAGCSEHGVLISRDKGTRWISANQGLPQKPSIPCFAESETGIFAVCAGHGVFLSMDNGKSWEAMSVKGLPQKASVHCLAVSEGNLFAGTYENGVYMLANGEIRWKPVNRGFPRKVHVFCIAASDSHLFVGTEMDGVFLSANNGGRWDAVNTGMPETEIHCLMPYGTNILAGTGGGHDVLFANNDIQHILHGGGVLVSSDNGARWDALNSGLSKTPNLPLLKGRVPFWVECLAVSGPYLYLGTQEGEIWRLRLSEENREK